MYFKVTPFFFSCPNCDQEYFDTKEDLLKHIIIHNKEKPNCQLCGKTFFNNNKLRRHIIEVHEGRKNHMCNECGKCFARPDKLRDHEKVHLNTGTGNRNRNKKTVKEEPDDDSDALLEENDENLIEELLESDYAENQHDGEDIESFNKRQEANQRALDAANQVRRSFSPVYSSEISQGPLKNFNP